MFRYANLFCSKEKSQDCVQDVFADIWVYRHSLSNSVIVKAYLLASVRRRIARLRERNRGFKETVSIDSIKVLFDTSTEYQFILDEESVAKVERINMVLNKLPARQKEALYLRYYQGLGVEEIVDVLQINYQSVNNLLYRALLQIRKKLNNISPFLLMFFSNIF